MNCQKAATLNPSLVPSPLFPETCFPGPWRSGPIAPGLDANASLKVLVVNQGMSTVCCPPVSAVLNLLSTLRIRLQNLQESSMACSPAGCENLCCLYLHTGTSIPETRFQGRLLWKQRQNSFILENWVKPPPPLVLQISFYPLRTRRKSAMGKLMTLS